MDLSNTGRAKVEETSAKQSVMPGFQAFVAATPYAVKLSFAAAAISLVALVFFIPFRYKVIVLPRLIPHIYPDYTNFVLYLPDIFLVAALLFWGFSLILQHKKVQIRPLWLTVPLAGLTLISGMSVLASVDRVLSLYNFARLILLFGFYLLVLNQNNAQKMVTIAAGAQLGVQAVIGITQVLQQHSLGLQNFQELTLDPKWKGVSIVWSWLGTSLRAYGLTDHPNILGGCLSLALILLILAYIQTKGRLQTVILGFIVLGGTALFLTFSRSAWLGLTAGIGFLIVILSLQRRWESLKDILLLAIVSLIILAPVVWQNATYLGIRLGGNQSFTAPTPENQALNERVLLNQLAYSIFQLHPLTGVGVSAYPTALSQFKPNYPFDLQPPHLVVLDVAAETGVFGGVFYLLLVFAPWILLLRNIRRIPMSFDLIGVSAALLVISIISLLDYYPWMLEPGRLWMWLIWGLWGNAWIHAEKRKAYA